ncbi:MAG: DUF2971 domain-containing protein [Polaromonas sp.]|nr:DUF2971 domain-containing protein [Polaromonas sp.]
MISTGSLFFSRVESFNDPFEASFTLGSVEGMDRAIEKLLESDMPEHGKRNLRAGWLAMTENRKTSRGNAVVSCWHSSSYESAAMWSLYLKSNEGIAIRTTFKRLCNSFAVAKDTVLIGEVKYIDFERDSFNAGNMFEAFLHKRKSFEHEKEIRAIAPFGMPPDRLTAEARNIPVDLGELIESVVIAPTAPDWFFEVVEQTTRKFGFNFPIEKSTLTQQPYFGVERL